MFEGRVGAGTIAPYEHGQQLGRAKGREVLRHENGVLRQCGLFTHDSLVSTRTTFFENTRLGLLLAARLVAAAHIAAIAHAVEEANHLLEVLLSVHLRTTVTALSGERGLGLDARSLQQLIELLTLTIRDDIILITVEDDDRRIVFVDIIGSTETTIFVGLFGQLRVEQHVLRTILAHLHTFATVHIGEIHRTRPVAGSIDTAALAEEITEVAFEVDVIIADLRLLQTSSGSGDRGQMATAGKSAGSDERRVELVLCSLTTHETDDGTDIVNLCWPLGIHAAAVVRTNDGITCFEQCLADSAEVGHALAVVAEPRTAIDMDNDGIAGSLLLRQIDVAGVISLVIASIIDILPLLRGGKIYFRSLEAAKASSGLCL